MPELTIAAPDGTVLAGEEAGAGPPVVLVHGLTATRRYVVMGSRALERAGHRVVAYDARGHGASAPPASGDYAFDALAGDLLAVLDDRGVGRAVLAGASMGAHTLLRVALDHPERVAGLVVITPAYVPEAITDPQRLAMWDRLAAGLREGGVEGFLAASDLSALPERWRETVTRVMGQRLSRHEHPEAVADALEAVPRSRPFPDLQVLTELAQPAVVVGSRDEADPTHPLATARLYADVLPGARLVVEDEGASPLAWQGGQLSRVIAELAARSDVMSE
ncbi:MAG TPA: alpha/beta hydrolase [Solirubrobacteraceae bacterium]|nr:alpha/beta hydrolase [Solirubrobacteraceae bacterium]